jgi:hypothetical protein
LQLYNKIEFIMVIIKIKMIMMMKRMNDVDGSYDDDE